MVVKVVVVANVTVFVNIKRVKLYNFYNNYN